MPARRRCERGARPTSAFTDAETTERGARQLTDVVGEVRLVGVPARRGDHGEWLTAPRQVERLAESQDAREQLRAIAEQVVRAALQLACAHAHGGGHRGHPLAGSGAPDDLDGERIGRNRATSPVR